MAGKPQVIVRKPSGTPAANVSSALPANHGTFKSVDSRTNAFRAFKDIEGICRLALDLLDDKARRAQALENIRALCGQIEKS